MPLSLERGDTAGLIVHVEHLLAAGRWAGLLLAFSSSWVHCEGSIGSWLGESPGHEGEGSSTESIYRLIYMHV